MKAHLGKDIKFEGGLYDADGNKITGLPPMKNGDEVTISYTVTMDLMGGPVEYSDVQVRKTTPEEGREEIKISPIQFNSPAYFGDGVMVSDYDNCCPGCGYLSVGQAGDCETCDQCGWSKD